MSQRRAPTIKPAPTCTVGPSRPIDRPASSPPETSPILCSARAGETSHFRCAGVTSSSAARITCGMPEPNEPGAKRRIHHSTSTVSAGVHNSIAQGAAPRRPACACVASSDR